jgi:hypothetical protein
MDQHAVALSGEKKVGGQWNYIKNNVINPYKTGQKRLPTIEGASMTLQFRSRPMNASDVPECAKVIVEHPTIGPRYGKAVAQLGPAWLRLLSCEAKVAAVIEQINGSRATICFVGISAFVSDAFLHEMKAPPLRWMGPELATRIMQGGSPLLSAKQIREANSRDGMNLVVWEGCIRHGFEEHLELHRKLLELFLELHCGYFWKEVISQHMESVERLEWTLNTGGKLWDATARRYVESLQEDAREIIRVPHVVGVTREIENSRPGSWVGRLFDYRPPKIVFSPSERRLVVLALSGRTDEELSGDLGASLCTIKSTWRSVFSRAETHLPELFSSHSHADLDMCGRGKEKRRPFLAYLRDHPEELRPASRKMLNKTPSQRSPLPE